jgi:hypothetical protein
MGRKLGVKRGWIVDATHRPPYNLERKNISIVQETGWAAGTVRISGKNLAPTGI